MRIVALRVAAVAVALAAGLAAPRGAAACTGCEITRHMLIHDSTSIVLVQYRGRSGSEAVFDVVDVLKGPRVRTERLPASFSLPFSPRGRWLFVLLVGGGGAIFRVSGSGAVADPFLGEAQPSDYPRTLAGWYRALAGVPDTSTAAAPPAPPSPAPGLPAPLLLATALAGGAAMLRRLHGVRPNSMSAGARPPG